MVSIGDVLGRSSTGGGRGGLNKESVSASITHLQRRTVKRVVSQALADDPKPAVVIGSLATVNLPVQQEFNMNYFRCQMTWLGLKGRSWGGIREGGGNRVHRCMSVSLKSEGGGYSRSMAKWGQRFTS